MEPYKVTWLRAWKQKEVKNVGHFCNLLYCVTLGKADGPL